MWWLWQSVMLAVMAERVCRRSAAPLVVRARVKVVDGSMGQAVVAAHGQAFRSLLAALGADGSADSSDVETVDVTAARAEEIG